jgi:sulfide:quinone oxidoreductase
VTFSGPESVSGLLLDLEQVLVGRLRRVAFVVPGGVSWPLPLYELAFLTKEYLTDRGAVDADVVLVSPEERPLTVFGPQVSEAIAALLDQRGITCRFGTTAVSFEAGLLRTAPFDALETDRVIALPRLEGRRLAGLPCDPEGFIPVDHYCRVLFEADVYAAGDATRFPIKQGGIAAQQAATAAAHIARRAGSTAGPIPFKPVLRGLLLTGMVPRFLQAEPGTARSSISTEPLWWPPGKIVGRHLSPFLASMLDIPHESTPVSARG